MSENTSRETPDTPTPREGGANPDVVGQDRQPSKTPPSTPITERQKLAEARKAAQERHRATRTATPTRHEGIAAKTSPRGVQRPDSRGGRTKTDPKGTSLPLGGTESRKTPHTAERAQKTTRPSRLDALKTTARNLGSAAGGKTGERIARTLGQESTSTPKGSLSTDNAKLAVGGGKAIARAAAGDLAGGAWTGVKTLAKDKRLRNLALTSLAFVLALAVLVIPSMGSSGAIAGQSEQRNMIADDAANSYGSTSTVNLKIRNITSGTGVPWPIISAIYTLYGTSAPSADTTAASTKDGSAGEETDSTAARSISLGLDPKALKKAGVKDSDFNGQVRVIIDSMSVEQAKYADVDLLTGAKYQVAPDKQVTNVLEVTGGEDTTAGKATAKAKALWVSAIQRIPLEDGMNESKADAIYATAVQIAGGIKGCSTTLTSSSADTDSADATDGSSPNPTQSTSSQSEAADSENVDGTVNDATTGAITSNLLPQVPGFTDEQVRNANTIVYIGHQLNVPANGIVIALMAAMQESKLHNYANDGGNGSRTSIGANAAYWLGVAKLSMGYPHEAVGGDGDSVGLFQQRPQAGWAGDTNLPGATLIKNIMNTSWQTKAFYGGPGKPTANTGLLDIKDWEKLPLGVAAQAVQGSKFPDRYAYWEKQAKMLASALGAGIAISDPNCTPSDATADYTTNGSGIGAWGGYTNGAIPLSVLCEIPWAKGQYARCDGVKTLIALNEAFKAKFGTNIGITDSYRTYERQVYMKSVRGGYAATPGTSNHGWATALDLGTGIGTDYTSPQHIWFTQNAPKYGWVNPPWAKPGASFRLREPWHWEFTGIK